jgi:hypothetical protein
VFAAGIAPDIADRRGIEHWGLYSTANLLPVPIPGMIVVSMPALMSAARSRT